MSVKQNQSVSTRLRNMVKSNPSSVKISESEISVPTDNQARFSQTIQTHSGVTVAPTTGTNDSAWIDCDGFNDVVISQINDAATASHVHVFWSHDNGTTTHGTGTNVLTGTQQQKDPVQIPVKARYLRLRLSNTDASPHIMSAFVYLKV